MWVLGGCHDVMYPESFMLISLLEVCQEWGVRYVGTGRILRVPDRMYLVDPKDHILKVLCQYLFFWLTYECLLQWLQKCDRQTNRH